MESQSLALTLTQMADFSAVSIPSRKQGSFASSLFFCDLGGGGVLLIDLI